MRLIRSLTHRLLREEDGVTLVMAIAMVAILSITTAGILVAGTANQREALVSDQARQAFAIAEQALAYDEGMVYNSSNLGTAPPTTLQTLDNLPSGQSGTYYASSSNGTDWHLVATGTVGGITRTVTADATPPSSTTTTDFGIWNYLYQDSTSTCLTIDGGVTVSVPILARGNICMSGGVHVVNPSGGSPITVEAGGTFSDIGGSNLGTSSSPVASLGIGGCTSWSSNGTCLGTKQSSCTAQRTTVVSVPPGTSPCDGSGAPVYSQSVSSTLAVTPQMPCIGQPASLNPQCASDDGTWSVLHSHYDTQAAGSQMGCPLGLLDGNSTLDNSIGNAAPNRANKTGLFEYSYYPTPLSYDCKIGSNELRWQQTSTSSSNGTLYVNGTFYIDGSLSVGSGQQIQYTGQGTLYFTGGVTFAGGTSMCGIVNCTTNWDPDVNGIIMVAGCWKNSTGSTLITSTSSPCVNIGGGAYVQLGFYSTVGYKAAGGTGNMGPVLANTVEVSGGASTLIPFHHYPPGTPLESTTVSIPGTPPTNWSG